MEIIVKIYKTLLCACFFISTSSLAATAVEKNLSLINIIERLKTDGYTNIREIEFKKSYYKAQVISPDGCKLRFKIDAVTGNYEHPKFESMKGLAPMEIVKKINLAGYSEISKFEFSDGKYEIKALDSHSKPVELTVDSITGSIKSEKTKIKN